MMNITNHRLVGIPLVPSPNISGILNPNYIVMHYTAGWTADSAIKTLINPATKVSAHVVIDRDGKVVQLVPFNRVAWHAGPSKYDGHVGMNNFSVGIEIVNIGYLRAAKGGSGYEMSTAAGWKPVSSQQLSGYDLSIVQPHVRVGGGNYIWPAYTKVQITAVKEVFAALCASYKIKDVVSHEEIDTRGWKTDPGPAFPMKEFKSLLNTPERNDGAFPQKTGIVIPPALNVRSAAGTASGIVAVLHKENTVSVVTTNAGWTRVEYAPGKQGWVSSQYLTVL